MDLPEKIRKGIVELAERHRVRKVILFGSRARGDNWERSDVDLAATGGDVVRFALDVDEVIPTAMLQALTSDCQSRPYKYSHCPIHAFL